jgi:hypothetical protein
MPGRSNEENECTSLCSFVRIISRDARIHKTIRVTPAMAAGISDHVWGYEDIAALA